MKITKAHVVEGNLFQFMAEGEMKTSFDCTVVATGIDGKTYARDQISPL